MPPSRTVRSLLNALVVAFLVPREAGVDGIIDVPEDGVTRETLPRQADPVDLGPGSAFSDSSPEPDADRDR